MENVVKQRVIDLAEIKCESISAFTKAINVGQSTMSEYINRGKKPSGVIIAAILKQFPDVSAEWLLRGKGSMYITELPHVEMQDGDDKTEELTVELAKMTRKYNEAVLEIEELKAEYNKVLAQLDWASSIIKESLRKESAQKKLDEGSYY